VSVTYFSQAWVVWASFFLPAAVYVATPVELTLPFCWAVVQRA
jgi:hypothetical protein